MSKKTTAGQHDRDTAATRQRPQSHAGMEVVLFLAASLAGIYGLGQGLSGLFVPGGGISLPWLAVTGVAVFVLFAQMGRVHDNWPRRPQITPEKTASGEAAAEPSGTK